MYEKELLCLRHPQRSHTALLPCKLLRAANAVTQEQTSGVSAGQSMPHWLGCNDRGPDTLRVFSN